MRTSPVPVLIILAALPGLARADAADLLALVQPTRNDAATAVRVDALGFAADDFTPAQALSRADWLEQRRQRLSRPGALAIRIDGLDITTRGDRATARFAQSYRAGSLNLNETKTIELTLRNGAWKILEERLGR